MDRQLIKTLIDALEASDLTELEYTADGSTLRLVKGGPSRPAPKPVRPPVPTPTPVSNLVLAPLYGIVHLQRAPGADPFVAAGQTVQPGQVLCTIEAMKVFTDVCTDRAGTIAEIMVADAQEIEAGRPLVRLS